MLRFVAVLGLLGGCDLVFPKPPLVEKPKTPQTREEWDAHLRGELAKQEGDACVKVGWISDRAIKSQGLEAEAAEEIKAQQVSACRKLKGGGTLAETSDKPPEPEPLVWDVPCTRHEAEVKLRARGDKVIDKPAVEDAFAQCYNGRIKECQAALDTDVEKAAACWRKQPWPETLASVTAADVAATGSCLIETQAVMSDLKSCLAKKKPAERDACMTPYIGYVPKCVLLDAAKVWQTFPGHEDLERIANADAKRRAERDAKIAKEKAEQDARIAKEVARCNGATTIDIAERVSKSQDVAKVPGCRYKVAGNVLSKNNVYVQLADASGKHVFLLKTREAVDQKALAERTALFEMVESAELADGSKQRFAVFVLERK
jgi:hypothetical protein